MDMPISYSNGLQKKAKLLFINLENGLIGPRLFGAGMRIKHVCISDRFPVFRLLVSVET